MRIAPLFVLTSLLGVTGLVSRLQAQERGQPPEPKGVASASSTAAPSSPAGACDGDRFSCEPAHSWRGRAGDGSWWWQIEFSEPRPVGAILQVHGDHPVCLRNTPRSYLWQASTDGKEWQDLPGTAVADERRCFRLHRLTAAQKVRFLRLLIRVAEGEYPTLREVEFFAEPAADVAFPPWAVVVDTTGQKSIPGEGTGFLTLARSCKGWEGLQAQNVWLGEFNEALLAVEPRPLCAFLSGNFIDWCQQDRTHWRGTQEVLKNRNLPMWAACGGAQGLGILEEAGVDRPWDCPQCRDPKAPKLPIYTHIGNPPKVACGDYSACTFERGPHWVLQLAQDPVFKGLPREFRNMESHCGQLGWAPKGWVQIATKGTGGLTNMQCMRVRDRYIYAAQFHMEMAGTPESSRVLMGNFLALARAWGGYNPKGEAVPVPTAWAAQP
jgi:hypothetical protein